MINPLNYSSQKKHNPLLITDYHAIKKNNIRIIKKAENGNAFKFLQNNEPKENTNNLNYSLKINSSFSEKNKSKNTENNEIQKSLNKIHEEYQMNLQKNLKPKNKIKNKFNFKFAQLYNIQFRKEKKNNSMDKNSTSFN